MTKTEAKEKLRQRLVEEIGLSGDGRVTLKWFSENKWKPLRESTWREPSRLTNEHLLKRIYKRFGSVPLEDLDLVEMQLFLNALAQERAIGVYVFGAATAIAFLVASQS